MGLILTLVFFMRACVSKATFFSERSELVFELELLNKFGLHSKATFNGFELEFVREISARTV